jgi:adenylate kinase family enzyme
MSLPEIHRIAVIGNAGGGKTTLARRLAEIHVLPLTHVDAIQFLPGMVIRPHQESIRILREIQGQEKWIIDGFGPLDILQERLAKSERIILIDFPLWRHYWWCTKRQIKNLWSRRAELPEGCNEATWSQTVKLYKTLWQVHTKMRPELLRILAREAHKEKVLTIRTLSAWNHLHKHGV